MVSGVYLIQSGEFYKIGFTANLTRRLRQFKTGNPDIQLIHFWESEQPKILEKRLHLMMWEFRVINRREWFNFPDEAITFLKQLELEL